MSLVWFLCLILRQPILKPIGNDGAISKIAETFNNKKFVQSPDGGWLLPVSQASSFFLKQNPRPFGFGVHTHTLLIGLTNHTIYYVYYLILHDEKIGRLYEIDSKVPITQAFVWKRTRREKNQPLANRVNVLRSSPPPFKQDIWHNEKRRWEISWLIKPELVGHLSLLCVEALITNTHEARAIAMFKLLSWHQVVWFETMVKPLYLMQGIFRQSPSCFVQIGIY